MEESFRQILHSSRVEWTSAPRDKRKEILELVVRVDSDAVVKMKTAVRQAVGKFGFLTADDAEDFYEFCTTWLHEFDGKPEMLNVYEKIAIIRFANEVKP